jgi:hypothetical protein
MILVQPMLGLYPFQAFVWQIQIYKNGHVAHLFRNNHLLFMCQVKSIMWACDNSWKAKGQYVLFSFKYLIRINYYISLT